MGLKREIIKTIEHGVRIFDQGWDKIFHFLGTRKSNWRFPAKKLEILHFQIDFIILTKVISEMKIYKKFSRCIYRSWLNLSYLKILFYVFEKMLY